MTVDPALSKKIQFVLEAYKRSIHPVSTIVGPEQYVPSAGLDLYSLRSLTEPELDFLLERADQSYPAFVAAMCYYLERTKWFPGPTQLSEFLSRKINDPPAKPRGRPIMDWNRDQVILEAIFDLTVVCGLKSTPACELLAESSPEAGLHIEVGAISQIWKNQRRRELAIKIKLLSDQVVKLRDEGIDDDRRTSERHRFLSITKRLCREFG